MLAYGSSPLTGLGCDRPDVDACDLGDWTYTVHDGIEQTLGSAAVVDMVSHLHWTARRMCFRLIDNVTQKLSMGGIRVPLIASKEDCLEHLLSLIHI